MASYNELSGQEVNPDFRVKVEFIEAELQRSTIVIRNVSEQDEGCYRCLFITYQHGSVRNQTCLQIYELHEPVLHVEESPEDSLVSCSATGRPAPTVTLTVPQPLYVSHNNTVSVNNTNGTVTVTTTAVLSGLRDNSTTVGCAGRAPSGPQKEVFGMIPGKKQTSVDGLDEESGSSQSRSKLFFDFIDKVEFRRTELQRSTIVIRNVSEQDEGCYLCLFITYQHGSVRNQTCLQIYELHEPVLHVEESPEDSLVSCSATGRPAPTVTLTVPQPLYVSHNNTVSVNNTNGTVTVTTTAVLSGLRDNSTTVGCAVRAPSGPQKEVFGMIPGKKRTSVDGLDEESGSSQSRSTVAFAVVFVITFVIAIVAFLVIRVRKKT
ncbi:uncharacterized protein FYW49_019840 [Xenentodon cancila]